MNSTVAELKDMINIWMCQIDDYQQLATSEEDLTYFVWAYDYLDDMHRKFNPKEVSANTRNYIRMLIKDTFKRGSLLESEQIVS